MTMTDEKDSAEISNKGGTMNDFESLMQRVAELEDRVEKLETFKRLMGPQALDDPIVVAGGGDPVPEV